MSIIVRNLSKMFGLQRAVNDISFSINQTEIVGFLGPNGAGKSTTMKMITGYFQPDGGSVEVSGNEVSPGSIVSKKKVGYLPEANPLYYDMYVREYLAFVASVHQLKNIAAAVAKVIETTGLITEANKKIGQLSKGYKQRVGLAAALIHDPEVLVLDEPTSGLDPNQLVEIRDVIKKLGQNKTVLFSSHILQEVQALCDRVIIISKGRVVANDRLSNLIKENSATSVIIVSFKEVVPVELLEGLNFVVGIEQVKSPVEHDVIKYGSEYKITTSNADVVKKQLMAMSLKQNLSIVSLQSEGNSLEDIFKSLTKPQLENINQ